MKIWKFVVPVTLYVALVAGVQGTTNINADKTGDWAS